MLCASGAVEYIGGVDLDNSCQHISLTIVDVVNIETSVVECLCSSGAGRLFGDYEENVVWSSV